MTESKTIEEYLERESTTRVYYTVVYFSDLYRWQRELVEARENLRLVQDENADLMGAINSREGGKDED